MAGAPMSHRDAGSSDTLFVFRRDTPSHPKCDGPGAIFVFPCVQRAQPLSPHMKNFRNIIFWIHLAVGLTAGLVILIMSVTGVLLTYERQTIAWADARANQPAAAAVSDPLPVEAILATAQGAEGTAASGVTLFKDGGRPAEVTFGRGRILFIDRTTGEVLGNGSPGTRAFMSSLRDWHRWLGQDGENRNVARAITGACNIGFLFLVVSGFYLWWPRNWKKPALLKVVVFKRGLSGKARDFNWHNVIGFWSVIPLFVVVASAVVISYPWASDLVYRAAGEAPPPPRARRRGGERPQRPANVDGLNLLWARAAEREPGARSISLRVPGAKDSEATFTLDSGTGGEPGKKAELKLDRKSGAEVEYSPFTTQSRGRRWRAILRFAHTGEAYGLIGQTLAGLVSLGAAFLVWTGFALAYRRFMAWRGRRARTALAPKPPVAAGRV